MPCEVLQVDPVHPAAADIARAAQLLRAGGLVAFPTETVYGLGASALDPETVARIFHAKGRPAINPLIVHVADLADAKNLVTSWSSLAQRLADRFWPGPLTLVLPKQPHVPDVVTAGGDTIALRMPAHPVALALLRACKVPLAAPSANPSNGLSPTCADHVLRGLGDRIDLLLDAGPTSGGLESTVLDLTSDPPRLLRPGLVTTTELETILGPLSHASDDGPLRSPGQMARHYAPRTPLEIARPSRSRVEALCRQGLRVGWLSHEDEAPIDLSRVVRITMPADSVSYSAQLYQALHRLDDGLVDRIIVETPPGGAEWLAVHDRLRRASHQAIE